MGPMKGDKNISAEAAAAMVESGDWGSPITLQCDAREARIRATVIIGV